MSVVPECHATTNAMGDTNFSVTLPTSTSLMCVEGYQIQFNGESKTVSLSSPSANFTVNSGEGQSVQNEIVVYTLDHENRAGQVPCTYNITGEYFWRHMILHFRLIVLVLRYVTLLFIFSLAEGKYLFG